MAFEFKKIEEMDEEHLCNTISCYSPFINDSRKEQCRVELIKRWTKKKKKKTIYVKKDVVKEILENIIDNTDLNMSLKDSLVNQPKKE